MAEWQAEESAHERDGIWQSELAQAQSALLELRSNNARLQQQLDDTRAASSQAPVPAGQAEVALLQQQLAESQNRGLELQAQLDNLRREAQSSHSAPDAAPLSNDAGHAADQITALRAELEALRQVADAACLDCDRAKAQLSRCAADGPSVTQLLSR
jgi:chromosome segregation ATPase